MRNLLLGIAIGYLFQDAIDDLLGRSTLIKPEKKEPVSYSAVGATGPTGPTPVTDDPGKTSS